MSLLLSLDRLLQHEMGTGCPAGVAPSIWALLIGGRAESVVGMDKKVAERIESKLYARGLTFGFYSLIKFKVAFKFGMHTQKKTGSQITNIQHISDRTPHEVSLDM